MTCSLAMFKRKYKQQIFCISQQAYIEIWNHKVTDIKFNVRLLTQLSVSSSKD